jgi:hypothetical protein
MHRRWSVLFVVMVAALLGTENTAAQPGSSLAGTGLYEQARSPSLVEPVRCVRGRCTGDSRYRCAPGRASYRTHYCAATRCRSSGRVYCLCPCPASR